MTFDHYKYIFRRDHSYVYEAVNLINKKNACNAADRIMGKGVRQFTIDSTQRTKQILEA